MKFCLQKYDFLWKIVMKPCGIEKEKYIFQNKKNRLKRSVGLQAAVDGGVF